MLSLLLILLAMAQFTYADLTVAVANIECAFGHCDNFVLIYKKPILRGPFTEPNNELKMGCVGMTRFSGRTEEHIRDVLEELKALGVRIV